ncbi:Putative beta-lactamase HcpC precursor [Poriferisphaera corsica]|uniref:Beta-lactamase HcpC n=1 Tax=Poriferisphaera corsica TaxID=2528020 RepID=A0A517YU21_9BACT|nr:tetratricopeptide repeat protein [Poriferisphaera corsica]QDU33699.1 Putative beta-lactamase HcpC precursor [Poriferisphaera corsica]
MAYLEEGVKRGDAKCATSLGYLYVTGKYGIGVDAEKALKYLKIAENRGDLDAVIIRAESYFDGQGVEENKGRALEILLDNEYHENAAIFEKISEYYYHGASGLQDLAKAREYAKRAVDMGNPEACMMMARLEHEDFAPNKEKVAYWLNRASELGEPNGQYRLALMYVQGVMFEKSYLEAVNILKKLGLKNYTPAYRAMADIYMKGDQTLEKNERIALRYYLKAAQAGDLSCAYRLYTLQHELTQFKFTDEEIAKGFEILKAAADTGDVMAMSRVGRISWSKTYRHYNIARSVRYFKMAAERGDMKSAFAVGIVYDLYLKPAQYEKARQWYEIAAKGGSHEALNQLGRIYQHGLGVEKDLQQALGIYQMAMKKGVPIAMVNVGWFYENGVVVEKDVRRAMTLYKKAAHTGSADGMMSLGKLYYKGIGVARDQKKAYEYIRQAARLKLAEAQTFLTSNDVAW